MRKKLIIKRKQNLDISIMQILKVLINLNTSIKSLETLAVKKEEYNTKNQIIIEIEEEDFVDFEKFAKSIRLKYQAI